MGRKAKRQPQFSQRGLALIAVAGALAMLGVVTTEFTTDTDVDYEAAKNAQNDMRAHFLARSGMNLGRLVIRVQKLFDGAGGIQVADYLPMFIGAFGGSQAEVEALGEAVGVNTDVIEGLGLPYGPDDGFDLALTSDDGKINLNCAMGSQATQQALQTQLAAMFYPEAFDELFQHEDAEGWRRDRATQVAAMLDYVDRDSARWDAPGTPEEYGYETLRDDYRPKNNYLDSIGEIKLIRGIDDRMWTLFGSAFTVYGDCKVNVGAVQDVNLIAALIFVSAKNADDPILRDPSKLWALAQYVANARNLGISFSNLDQFRQFVEAPAGALGELLGADAQTGQQALSSAQTSLLPEGVELDPQKLAQVARAGPRRTYRVEATARLGRVEKRIVGVWDTSVQRQNARQPGQGAWVFWREE